MTHPHGRWRQEMLTSQYMASAKPDVTARRRRVGVVDYACDPVNICEQAARCPGLWPTTATGVLEMLKIGWKLTKITGDHNVGLRF